MNIFLIVLVLVCKFGNGLSFRSGVYSYYGQILPADVKDLSSLTTKYCVFSFRENSSLKKTRILVTS